MSQFKKINLLFLAYTLQMCNFMDTIEAITLKNNKLSMSSDKTASKPPFIPAQESPLFVKAFTYYMNWFFRYRFRNIWLSQHYFPEEDSKTIYFLNHTTWWDGLIPLFLNENVLKQKGRAMMEDKQMLKYSFFKKIGAFSVHLDNPKSALVSLRYAVKSMQRPNAALFIYPEGEINTFSYNKPTFKQGLAWLTEQVPDADVVPVGIYMHCMYKSKPELVIRIDSAVEIDHTQGSDAINDSLQMEMRNTLRALYKQVKDEESLTPLL